MIGASPLAAAAEAFGWREVMLGLVARSRCSMRWRSSSSYAIRRKLPENGVGRAGFGGYLDLLKYPHAVAPAAADRGELCPRHGHSAGSGRGHTSPRCNGAEALLIGHVTLIMALAMVVGNFVYGPLDTFFRTRKWVAVVGNLIGLSALLTLAMMPQRRRLDGNGAVCDHRRLGRCLRPL